MYFTFLSLVFLISLVYSNSGFIHFICSRTKHPAYCWLNHPKCMLSNLTHMLIRTSRSVSDPIIPSNLSNGINHFNLVLFLSLPLLNFFSFAYSSWYNVVYLCVHSCVCVSFQRRSHTITLTPLETFNSLCSSDWLENCSLPISASKW